MEKKPKAEKQSLIEKYKLSRPFFLVSLFILCAIFGLLNFFLQRTTPLPTVFLSPDEKSILGGQFDVVLSSPLEGQKIDGEKVAIIGKTFPGTVVLAYSLFDETSVEADNQGNFTTNLYLDEDRNTFTVKAYGEDGQEKELMRQVNRDILLEASASAAQKQALAGVVTALKDNLITLDNTNQILTVPATLVVGDLQVGKRVAMVVFEESGMVARLIHVIPSKATTGEDIDVQL